MRPTELAIELRGLLDLVFFRLELFSSMITET